MVKKIPQKKASASGASEKVVYSLDVSVPVADKLLALDSIVSFYKAHLKVKSQGSVKGALGGLVDIKATPEAISFTVTDSAMPKKQVKYLAKRMIKHNQLDQFMRVVATKDGYKIKLFDISEDAADAAPEEEADDDIAKAD